ncbi:MAG: YifB family Mg chelatase-like AAA ATPase [Candidatus Nomurabacteria bacterium]|jgi:magnesium chelatase family protein|nr:YifB family Mg chelatase-like AAA ATPase [Candidatus Nomurabacteria bacterium]
MVARTLTAVTIGFDDQPVTVECDMTKGLPAFNIVGLADKSVNEAKERVRAAISNSDLIFPAKRITINLAPANLSKEGSHFDLPIAMAILTASGQLRNDALKNVLLAGELSLNGELRPIRGALSLAECARRNGYDTIILPVKNVAQAALLDNLNVVGATTLTDVLLHLLGEKVITPAEQTVVKNTSIITPSIDDIRGQESAKRALIIAAAGHHNLLFTGSPGAGKTMLARTLPGLLPSLTPDEIFETTKIYSLAGEADDVVTTRPFRAPHHTASFVALIGGGTKAKPGEISLAHHGVLFLDEIPEFPRASLEALRQPLEDRVVHIARASGRVTYPAHFMLVATMNPCPCGYYGDDKHECTCTQQQILLYQKRLSGPLLDRIDMIIPVARVPRDKLFADKASSDKPRATEWRKQIENARIIQVKRQKRPNSALTNKQLEKFAVLDPKTKDLLTAAAERLNLSARGYFKTLRVARTVADLNEHTQIVAEDVAEALRYRQN